LVQDIRPRRQQQSAHIRGDLSAAEVGTDGEARSGRKPELLRGKISSRARTGGHFLRIGFLITQIISNTYHVTRPLYAKSGLELRLSTLGLACGFAGLTPFVFAFGCELGRVRRVGANALWLE